MTGTRLRLAAGLAVGASLIGLAVPAPASARAQAPTLDWKPCKLKPEDAPGAECATLRLPVDWARPNGPKFDLALARRKATDPGARVGNLVFGPGGPGDSGREKVVSSPTARFSPEMLRRFDVVSFDPRGIGGSNPVTCSTGKLRARPSPIMKSQADFDATVKYNRELAADCRENTPNGLYDHVDTLSMVRDLDAVRAALGDRKLTFHGSSYGTLLGQQYAEQYPGRIRAMVLESVFDRSVRTTRSFLQTQADTAQDTFDQFVKWCETTKDCALHGQDVRALWRNLLARAERGELSVDLLTLVNREAFKALYRPERWPGFAARIAELSKPAATTKTAAASATSTDATPIFCSDWNFPVRDYRDYDRHVRRMSKAAPDMPYLLPLHMTAACLGSKAVNPQHRLKIGKTPPILVANALHDPATAYTWAASVARQIGRQGVLLTYEGSGHGSTDRGPCMEGATDRYLVSVQAPPRGTTCPAV